MRSTRLILAIDLTTVEKQALHCISHELRAQFKEGLINTEDMYHITLHFFESVPEDSAEAIKRVMKKAAAAQKPFTVVTGHPGFYRSPESAVVWIGMNDGQAELEQLHAKIEKLLAGTGFLEENRPYQPHVTLGREINTQAFKTPLAEILLPSVNLSARALTLLESKAVDGKPVYVTLASAEFKGK
jgi:RNA 2',3'-cyclic 3'-phosphodiesterase